MELLDESIPQQVREALNTTGATLRILACRGAASTPHLIFWDSLACSAVDSLLKFIVQLLDCFKLFIVHDATRMRNNLTELLEVLLLQQEHHVVSKDECVTWAHINGLFERHLSVVNI